MAELDITDSDGPPEESVDLDDSMSDSAWADDVFKHVSALSESVQASLHQVTQALNEKSDALADAGRRLKRKIDTSLLETREEKRAMMEDIVEERKILQADVKKLAAEKESMKGVHTFQTGRVKLDVGGHKFTTSLATLTSQPDSMLAAMFSGRHKLVTDEEGAYFIDRDGTHFRFILNFLRDSQLVEGTLPEDRFQLQEILRECEYYQLTKLTEHIRLKLMPIVTQADIDELKYEFVNPRRRHHEVGNISINIQYACMDGKNLSNVDFSGVRFRNRFSFKGSCLRGANFSYCKFRSKVYFNDADLTDANFDDCEGMLPEFGFVDFTGAKLEGAKFNGSE